MVVTAAGRGAKESPLVAGSSAGFANVCWVMRVSVVVGGYNVVAFSKPHRVRSDDAIGYEWAFF